MSEVPLYSPSGVGSVGYLSFSLSLSLSASSPSSLSLQVPEGL